MKYAYLFIPGLVILALPMIKALVDGHKAKVAKKAQIAAKEAREAARREALRKANEAREAKKAAEEAAKAAMPKRKPGRPRKNPLPEERPEIISPAAPVSPVAPAAINRPAVYIGNNMFVGETVAFTGTLPGMTRREAIEAVKKNGGKAYDNMPAGTTVLVVGDRPGKRKLDNADKWIGSCRKITAEQFFIMLRMPLTFEPDAFVSFLGQRLANNNA
jgi:NAD-dependent DNA ligase